MIEVRTKLEWGGDACVELVRREADARTAAAADHLFAALVDALSTPYPPASKPGEPPHKRSGGLARGLTRSFDGKAWRVGFFPRVRAQALALDQGTRRVRARPVFLGVLKKEMLRLREIAARKS